MRWSRSCARKGGNDAAWDVDTPLPSPPIPPSLSREIRKHQCPQLSSLWTTLFAPLLVLKRPWLGDEALGLFPWGYFESTDRLLGLGR